MNKFEKDYNYDNVLIRDLTIGVLSEIHRKIRWTNTWNDVKKLVTLPVYYGMVGDERFLYDAFVDDIVGIRPDLNIDAIPRAHLIFENANIKRNEFSNPNVNMEFYKEENGILKKQAGKFRVLTIDATYNLKIELDSEIDIMKCYQSLWDWLWVYKYFYVTYNSFRIDCVLHTPDDYQQQITREIENIGSKDDTKKFIEINFNVHAFYPIEPKETKPTLTNCGRAIFKGRMWSLGKQDDRRTFIGSDINKNDKK